MSICTECETREAVTRDGLLCRKCLTEWLKNGNSFTSAVHEQRGRKAVSSQLLGGVPDMREAESMQ
jgi:hypothetical protein